MFKVGFYSESAEHGPAALPLFGPADSYFEKTASQRVLPEVAQFIAGLRPKNDALYVLVNAMGASEYYGSNVNGDHFPEAALTHAPNGWTGVPDVDRVKAAKWAYGYPTFYNAHIYPHHKNNDPSKRIGDVEMVAWNPHMRRVEIVTRLDYELCQRHGGMGAWDKLKAGGFPDVSMGSKVPFDTCSITLDKAEYNKAWGTFDPKLHKHPGEAILAHHKKLRQRRGRGIEGLSITRRDYSDWCLNHMNKILPDGRKVWVYNDFPRFFDLSYVFIGADKIAKSMWKIADGGRVYSFMSSAEVAETVGRADDGEKLAWAQGTEHYAAKAAEIAKKHLPSNLVGKAIPVITAKEPALPAPLLDVLGQIAPMEVVLSTTSSLGIVLRPSEYQRVRSEQALRSNWADRPTCANLSPVSLGKAAPAPLRMESVSPVIAALLSPFMAARSGLGPHVELRALTAGLGQDLAARLPERVSLDKTAEEYRGYRAALMDFASSIPDALAAAAMDVDLQKTAQASVEDLFTPLAYRYLRDAYM